MAIEAEKTSTFEDQGEDGEKKRMKKKKDKIYPGEVESEHSSGELDNSAVIFNSLLMVIVSRL